MGNKPNQNLDTNQEMEKFIETCRNSSTINVHSIVVDPEDLTKFVDKLIQSARLQGYESGVKEILKIDIGAIPTSDPYALGWNEARQTYYQSIASLSDSEGSIDK